MAVLVAAQNPKVTNVLAVYPKLSAHPCPVRLTGQYDPNEVALHCTALQSLLHHRKGLFEHDCLAEQTALHRLVEFTGLLCLVVSMWTAQDYIAQLNYTVLFWSPGR